MKIATVYKLAKGTTVFEFYPHDRYSMGVEKVQNGKTVAVYGKYTPEKARELWRKLVGWGFCQK